MRGHECRLRDDSLGDGVCDLRVTDRVRPGKRWLYVVEDTRDGQVRHVWGSTLVRLARAARRHGVRVVMLGEPWRDTA